MCKYCEEHVLEEGGYDIEPICEREESKYNHGCFTGIDVHLEKDKLKMYAVVDGQNVKCLHAEKEIKINFCPMCGRKLESDNATTEQ